METKSFTGATTLGKTCKNHARKQLIDLLDSVRVRLRLVCFNVLQRVAMSSVGAGEERTRVGSFSERTAESYCRISVAKGP